MIRTNNTGKCDAIIVVLMAISIISFVIAGGARLVTNMKKSMSYKKAIKSYEDGIEKCDIGELEDARSGFTEVQGYKDSDTYITKTNEAMENIDKYEDAEVYLDSGDYENAINNFIELGDFKDSRAKLEDISQVLYSNAVSCENGIGFGQGTGGRRKGIQKCYSDLVRTFASFGGIEVFER